MLRDSEGWECCGIKIWNTQPGHLTEQRLADAYFVYAGPIDVNHALTT